MNNNIHKYQIDVDGNDVVVEMGYNDVTLIINDQELYNTTDYRNSPFIDRMSDESCLVFLSFLSDYFQYNDITEYPWNTFDELNHVELQTLFDVVTNMRWDDVDIALMDIEEEREKEEEQDV